ncbi:hypothetical protein ACVIQT_008412 [Bradyrhizobium diazoefficiens]
MGTTITNNPPRPEPKALASALEQLAARFGNRLITSQAVREQHGHTTTWIPNQPPDGVVMAQETADIQDVVRICARNRVPVIAFGTGTSLEGQVNAPAGGISIDLRDMNKVLAVHAEDLDCVIQPGVTRKALNEHLRDQGLFFPIDPGADASLGGMASTRASGTNAVRYGTMRDSVLALKVVRGDGEIITTGTRAKKSSAGYDLTHLLVGAEGTLGIISELTIRLRGIPETIAAGAVSFETVHGACQAVILAIQTGIPVARIELLNAAQVKACNAYSKLTLPETPLLLMEFHGSEIEVAEQSKAFGEIAKECGGGDFSWTTKPEVAPSCGRPGTMPIGPSRRCGPATASAWSQPTSACRSRGSPNASAKPRKISSGSICCRRSSGMSATAISTARWSATPTMPTRWRAARSSCIASSSARRRWTAPAPASTASARASRNISRPSLAPRRSTRCGR